MKLLVTGGTGYIGSHTVVELLQAQHQVTIIDNLSNSKESVVDAIASLCDIRPEFIKLDLRDETGLEALFASHAFDAVIHFAGLKAVGESVAEPLKYYDNNVGGTLSLLAAMQRHGVYSLVFSSSATVYGDPHTVPITEEFPLHTTNPYGTTKWMIEQILQDLVHAHPEWSVALLRYFNPIGAHPSGQLGENPNGIPNNLMPYIVKVAHRDLPELQVYGNDYPTPDGTGVRDYLHVVDLSMGHLKALDYLASHTGVHVFNLGTGQGYSVLQMIEAFQRVNRVHVPYRIVGRRPGDIATCYADPSKAARELGWKTHFTLDDMCQDSWNYIQSKKEKHL